MKRLQDEDYLLELALRIAVRRKFGASVAVSSEHSEDDDTGEQRVLGAVMDICDGALLSHEGIEADASKASRFPLKQWRDHLTIGAGKSRLARRKKVNSPLKKCWKKNLA